MGCAYGGLMSKRVSQRLDEMRPIQRTSDASGFFANWSGGIQAIKADEHQWRILPVLTGGRPCANGFYSKAEMQQFLIERGVQFVGFENVSWTNGSYTSSWSPRIPGRTNFLRGPANLWRSISSNIRQIRIQPLLDKLDEPTEEGLAAILDARTEPERLAQSIGLSLRNMDISVRGIFEFYHEELTNLLAHGHTNGTRSASMRDQVLFAHIHAFFLHLGSARDYLATLIAFRLERSAHKTDSLAKLLEVTRLIDVDRDPLLAMLSSQGYITQHQKKPSQLQQAGWLAKATDQRNELTHRRTYGDVFIEKAGHLTVIDEEAGLFRYTRPMGGSYPASDVFDAILTHYAKANELFCAAAETTKYNTSILTITDDDIVCEEEQK